ncbi:MAG: hypothetical protein DWQ01_04775 [Planctomycetota bacterium]|nr:MAG: hypothetical protein DWQ01_04775 [Planctomycetota bacterium]
MSRLGEMIRAGASLEEIAQFLDQSSEQVRIEETRSLGGKDQARLFELAEGHPADLEQLVPNQAGNGKPVRHFGLNSLPAFRKFEKRFMRGENGEQIWGYNHQATMGLVGPGYFVVDAPESGQDLLIDYTRIPDQQPGADWPKLKSNEALPTRFVFGGLQDRLRRVSRHVSIGHAWRRGKPMKNWFVLCREELPH